METELKTFRVHKDVLTALRGICEYREELPRHVNKALREYAQKLKLIDTGEQKPPKKESQTKTINSLADDVIDMLNLKAETKYRKTDANRKIIGARLKDYTVNECFEVIEKKCQEWKGTEFEKYLRPSTLFQASKFDGYLNQKITPNGQHSEGFNEWLHGEKVIDGEVIQNDPREQERLI